jgi:hypothetical protein
MRRRDDYDPGDRNDPLPRRRGRRFDEYDDGWAGGDEDADWDDPAGSLWESPEQGTGSDDDDAISPISPRRRRYRSRRLSSNYYDNPASRPDRAPQSQYSDAPYDSRTYHRDRAHRGEYAEYYEDEYAKPKRGRSRPFSLGASSAMLPIPYWQILLLVILGMLAFLAAALACVSILAL